MGAAEIGLRLALKDRRKVASELAATGKDVGKVGSAAKKSTDLAKKGFLGLQTSIGKVAAIAGGLAATLGVKKILATTTTAFSDLATQVAGIRRVAGGTVEQASRLRTALQLSGVDSSKAATSLTIFAKNLGKASADSKKAAKMTDLLGQSFTNTDGSVKSMHQILPGLADRFAEMPEGIAKTTLATQLFGKSGTAMIPFLNKGASGLAELRKQSDQLGLTLDQNGIDKFAEYRKAQRVWQATTQGLRVTIGAALLPVLTRWSQIMTANVTPAIRGLIGWLRETGAFDLFGRVVERVAEVLGVLGGKARQIIVDGLFQYVAEHQDAFKTLAVGIGGAVVALTALSSVMKAVTLATTLLNVVMALNPATLVVLAIAGLGAALAVTYKRSESFRANVSQLGEYLRANVLPALLEFGRHLRTVVLPALIETAKRIEAKLRPALKAVAAFVVDSLIPAILTFGEFLRTKIVPILVDTARKIATKLQPVLAALGTFITGSLVPFLKQFGDKLREWWPTIQRVTVFMAKLQSKLLVFYATVAGKVIPVVLKVAGFLLRNLIPAISFVIDVIKKWWKATAPVRDFWVFIIKKLAEFARLVGRTVIPVVLRIADGFLKMAKFSVQAFQFLFEVALKAFDGILSAAEKGLGWVPGLGDKIKNARKGFKAFRDSTVQALNGVAEKVDDASRALDALANPRTATVTYVSKYVAVRQDRNNAALGEPRALGGPVVKGRPYVVGEERPELFVPNEDGTILPKVVPYRFPTSTDSMAAIHRDLDATAAADGAVPMSEALTIISQLVVDGRVLGESNSKYERNAEARA